MNGIAWNALPLSFPRKRESSSNAIHFVVPVDSGSRFASPEWLTPSLKAYIVRGPMYLRAMTKSPMRT